LNSRPALPQIQTLAVLGCQVATFKNIRNNYDHLLLLTQKAQNQQVLFAICL
jgi:hypothetical protein